MSEQRIPRPVMRPSEDIVPSGPKSIIALFIVVIFVLIALLGSGG